MIYTGYFNRLNSYIKAGLVPISIAGKCPDFYKGIEYKKLAPKYSFFIEYKNKQINSDQYTEKYNKLVLEPLDKIKIIEELNILADNKDIVLLCWEKPNEFCHRNLVSKWLSDLYIVQEYNTAKQDEQTFLENKDFERAYSIGQIGENVFIEYINKNLKPGSVLRDVREDKEFQNKDIDFIIENLDINEVKTFEVKTETTLSNKFSIVYWKDINQQKKGWIQVTEADYIFLYKQQTNKAYILNTPLLKKYVNQLPTKSLEILYARSPRQALGYVVSLMELQNHNVIVRTISL